jgi:hypothetical protein
MHLRAPEIGPGRSRGKRGASKWAAHENRTDRARALPSAACAGFVFDAVAAALLDVGHIPFASLVASAARGTWQRMNRAEAP